MTNRLNLRLNPDVFESLRYRKAFRQYWGRCEVEMKVKEVR